MCIWLSRVILTLLSDTVTIAVSTGRVIFRLLSMACAEDSPTPVTEDPYSPQKVNFWFDLSRIGCLEFELPIWTDHCRKRNLYFVPSSFIPPLLFRNVFEFFLLDREEWSHKYVIVGKPGMSLERSRATECLLFQKLSSSICSRLASFFRK